MRTPGRRKIESLMSRIKGANRKEYAHFIESEPVEVLFECFYCDNTDPFDHECTYSRKDAYPDNWAIVEVEEDIK